MIEETVCPTPSTLNRSAGVALVWKVPPSTRRAAWAWTDDHLLRSGASAASCGHFVRITRRQDAERPGKGSLLPTNLRATCKNAPSPSPFAGQLHLLQPQHAPPRDHASFRLSRDDGPWFLSPGSCLLPPYPLTPDPPRPQNLLPQPVSACGRRRPGLVGAHVALDQRCRLGPVDLPVFLCNARGPGDALSGCGRGVSSPASQRGSVRTAMPQAGELWGERAGRVAPGDGTYAALSTGPVSTPGIHPHDADAGLHVAGKDGRGDGRGPAVRGSTEPWTLMQPKRGRSSTSWRQDQAVGRDHDHVRARPASVARVSAARRVRGGLIVSPWAREPSEG